MCLYNAVSLVPIRCVTNPFHVLFLVLCSALCIALGAANAARASDVAQTASPIQLSVADVRDLAVQALRDGDFPLAIQLSRALLQVDPEDTVAYFVLSMAHGSLGDATLSRKAAGYAFQYSDNSQDKFRAGQLAAQAAFGENRLSLAQYWLRRAAIHADSDEEKEIIAQDYQTLRRLNPWSVRLGISIRPSNNVNNGSEDALQIIDGVPVTGRLSGAAQALSGVIMTVDLAGRYRFAVSDVSSSFVSFRLYTRQVALSDNSKEQAPELSNSDLAQYYVETALSHRRQANQGVIGGTVAIGQSWNGNDPSYHFLRFSGDRVWSRDGALWYGLGAAVEERFGVDGPRFDATALSLTLRGGIQRENGDELILTLGLRDTDATFVNDNSQAVSLRSAYEFANAFGPVKLGMALTLGYADYDQYRSGPIVVPGGRQDRSAYADVDLTFVDIDYAGFSPSLRFRIGRTRSNDSRFNTREASVSLGIESKF